MIYYIVIILFNWSFHFSEYSWVSCFEAIYVIIFYYVWCETWLNVAQQEHSHSLWQQSLWMFITDDFKVSFMRGRLCYFKLHQLALRKLWNEISLTHHLPNPTESFYDWSYNRTDICFNIRRTHCLYQNKPVYLGINMNTRMLSYFYHLAYISRRFAPKCLMVKWHQSMP